MLCYAMWNDDMETVWRVDRSMPNERKASSDDAVRAGVHDPTDEQVGEHRKHHQGAAHSEQISPAVVARSYRLVRFLGGVVGAVAARRSSRCVLWRRC